VVMGHVDHGKTTLLDTIRNTRVTEQEFGGITQHIGAFQVEVESGGEKRKITFLDTPGHEAFTQIRSRGARVADIAILVVAADDGVMPQTEEAIDHARAADVPIIVAINKIDLENANPQRVLTELLNHELVPEAMGGDVPTFEISALENFGIEELLGDGVLTVADVLVEPKAEPSGPAEGAIIEARLDPHRGPVATVLIESGTLRRGDVVLVGETFGRVKAMNDDVGAPVSEAGPSVPVEILGLSDVAAAGDRLQVCANEREARQLAGQRASDAREERIGSSGVSLEDLFAQFQQGEMKELNVVVKADVRGSLEAVVDSLEKLGGEEVKVDIIRGGVGNISSSDIQLAAVSKAIVLGFNVKADAAARREAQQDGIEIRTYQVIYELIEAIESTLKGMLAPEYREVSVGKAEVRAVFKLPGNRVVAGCAVEVGRVLRDADVRVRRNGEMVLDSTITSLRHFQETVREVGAGAECGILIADYDEPQAGDILEVYRTEQVPRQ